MAYLFFCGDAAVHVPTSAETLQEALTDSGGVLIDGFVSVETDSGGALRVNARQVAYIVDDELAAQRKMVHERS